MVKINFIFINYAVSSARLRSPMCFDTSSKLVDILSAKSFWPEAMISSVSPRFSIWLLYRELISFCELGLSNKLLRSLLSLLVEALLRASCKDDLLRKDDLFGPLRPSLPCFSCRSRDDLFGPLRPSFLSVFSGRSKDDLFGPLS